MEISIIISSETVLLYFKLFILVLVIYVKWVDGKEAWESYEVDNPVYVHSAQSLGLKGAVCIEEAIEKSLGTKPDSN